MRRRLVKKMRDVPRRCLGRQRTWGSLEPAPECMSWAPDYINPPPCPPKKKMLPLPISPHGNVWPREKKTPCKGEERAASILGLRWRVPTVRVCFQVLSRSLWNSKQLPSGCAHLAGSRRSLTRATRVQAGTSMRRRASGGELP